MAGHIIAIYLKEQGHEVVGFARTPSDFVQTVVGDAYDTKLIEKCLSEGNYDAIINCIGMLNQFAENDKADAAFLNGYFSEVFGFLFHLFLLEFICLIDFKSCKPLQVFEKVICKTCILIPVSA